MDLAFRSIVCKEDLGKCKICTKKDQIVASIENEQSSSTHVICPECKYSYPGVFEGDKEYAEFCEKCNAEFRVLIDFEVRWRTKRKVSNEEIEEKLKENL
jgi:hypothetical protein